MARKQIDTNGHDFTIWQIDGSANSSVPFRYVVHYLAIPEPYEISQDADFDTFCKHQTAHINHAKAMLHGTKYRAKWFGGGIVFQAYAGDPVGHVLAAIKSAETGLSFVDAYAAVRDGR